MRTLRFFCVEDPASSVARCLIALFASLVPILLPMAAMAGYKEGEVAARAGDYTAARREYLEAAADGNPLAQNNLGQLYAKGLGGPIDYAGALRWYMTAAAAGQVNAQTSLADMFETGKSGTVDYIRGLYWYRRAAVSGFFIAQLSLASMLEDGRGVQSDRVAALAWYLLSTREQPRASNGYYVKEFNEAVQARDRLSAHLTSTEINEAKSLAAQWTPGITIEELRSSAHRTVTAHETIVLRREGGTFVLPTVINGCITIDFVLDSGAADVSIPADVAMTLMRTNTLTDRDFLGQATYILADGSHLPSQVIHLKSLQVGDLEIRDIVASVAPANGSLLLGQSFLSKLPSWTIDNRIPALKIERP